MSQNYIENLGFNEYFENESKPYLRENLSLYRITQVNKNNYKVSSGNKEILAELSGRFLFDAERSLDYPTIGDWVAAESFDENSLAIIHNVIPRKSLLKRKHPGRDVEFQLIAANIDYALILQSADANFNLNRLERYLVMAEEGKITPIIVLSKTDLASSEEMEKFNEAVKRFKEKYLFIPISSISENGTEPLKEKLLPGKTYCLLGSSGVGKTSLLNNLIGEDKYEVREVRSKDSRGRHTTVKRELIVLDSGAILIDTPGMRELGNFDISTGLDAAFDEIAEYGKNCRFADCTHTHESGCAIIKAVNNGSIDEARYNNYLKIRKEAAHYDMSDLERKRKDKSLSKLVKNYYKIQKGKRK